MIQRITELEKAQSLFLLALFRYILLEFDNIWLYCGEAYRHCCKLF